MTKKVDKEKCFSVITKNSNWKILTKNLVTVLLKDKIGFNISGVHWKIWFLGGGKFTKNQYRVEGLTKQRGLGQFADLRGSLARQERGSGVFEEEGRLILQYTLWPFWNGIKTEDHWTLKILKEAF